MFHRSAVTGALALALLVPPVAGLAQEKSPMAPPPGATHAAPDSAPPAAGTVAPGAPETPGKGPAIATVLGRTITRADLGPTPPMIAQIAQGDTAKLGQMTTAWESQALTGLVLGMLLDRYAEKKKIEASPAEISEMLLAAARVASSPEAVKAGAPRPDTTHAEVRKAGAAVVQRFKMNAALHAEYGGRVLVDPQAGPMPFDAFKLFLQAEEKSGAFTITPAWTPRFWAAFAGEEGKQFVPAAEGKAMITKAWWRETP
jgi:hypothetical protein